MIVKICCQCEHKSGEKTWIKRVWTRTGYQIYINATVAWLMVKAFQLIIFNICVVFLPCIIYCKKISELMSQTFFLI